MSEDQSKLEKLKARKVVAQTLYETDLDDGPKIKLLEHITALENEISEEEYKVRLLNGDE